MTGEEGVRAFRAHRNQIAFPPPEIIGNGRLTGVHSPSFSDALFPVAGRELGAAGEELLRILEAVVLGTRVTLL